MVSLFNVPRLAENLLPLDIVTSKPLWLHSELHLYACSHLLTRGKLAHVLYLRREACRHMFSTYDARHVGTCSLPTLLYWLKGGYDPFWYARYASACCCSSCGFCGRLCDGGGDDLLTISLWFVCAALEPCRLTHLASSAMAEKQSTCITDSLCQLCTPHQVNLDQTIHPPSVAAPQSDKRACPTYFLKSPCEHPVRRCVRFRSRLIHAWV
jgi:hypothetical protein